MVDYTAKVVSKLMGGDRYGVQKSSAGYRSPPISLLTTLAV